MTNRNLCTQKVFLNRRWIPQPSSIVWKVPGRLSSCNLQRWQSRTVSIPTMTLPSASQILWQCWKPWRMYFHSSWSMGALSTWAISAPSRSTCKKTLFPDATSSFDNDQNNNILQFICGELKRVLIRLSTRTYPFINAYLSVHQRILIRFTTGTSPFYSGILSV